jgi:hypothetical protein
MIFSNHRQLVKLKEAERYWNVRPANAQKYSLRVSKIVSIESLNKRANIGARMKKIITTVALTLAAISAAHGVIGDNPFQLVAHFKTKPIVVEQMTPRTIKVVYVEDGRITVVTLLDGISKAELMARADNGLVGCEDMKAQVAHYGGKFQMWNQDKPRTEDLFAWVRPDERLFFAVGKTTLPDGKKYNWLIIFETPASWGGRAEEIARGLNESKTHLRSERH